MLSVRSFIGSTMVIAFLFCPLNTWASDTPMTTIQSATHETLEILQNPTYQGTTHRQARLAQLASVILPYFDTTGLAQRALGPGWHQLTTDQQQTFVRLFTSLVEQSYGAIIDRYARDVQISYDSEHIDGDYAEVATRIFAPSVDQSFPINYFLHLLHGQWLIYDVEIDNVSMALNYRNQFAHILRTASYPDLVQRLQSKLHELSGAPS